MPHSHHSHSGQFCKHASGSLEEVVLEAIRQQFQLYGLTEHVPRYRLVDLYPEEAGETTDSLAKQFEKFLVEAHRLKTHYASQITILVGLETEYITGQDLDGLDSLLQKFGDRVEYVVGSVHHVDGIPIDFDQITYERALHNFGDGETNAQEVFLSTYFDAQYQLLQRFKPEIVGHFDLCRLYTPDLRFLEYPSVWEKITRNVEYAIGYGALFETNAAAFRKGWETAYPGKDILILNCGGRFALSDDSHGPRFVGLNYHRLLDYLHAQGVTDIWLLQPSKTPNAAGRSIRPVKFEGEWLGHEFWHGRSTQA
ncbi:uncharacterized protein LACBIDRAFT_248175 [Laccaria bicolor S238N-H82]|uniref:Histidinol-phosphatase n=1 Tax=Laccaria bicolor (strain S238N-H82 / ATCC MYA-4686) TaxID=486041 RepID=B0D579_LACBS|nr:uncharacterized protein LACBIDRAFT_248175 [Laccaria bicolor S238N-H82]EDR10230.1 predicted protein [Laccaria bicolor S238N-H82]|eukprot:XP_001878680.1 predicted protein [Laccaria bicolor S238N-H82]